MPDQKTLVNPKTGRKFLIGGCKVKKRPSNCPKFGASRKIATTNLPRTIDLRQNMTSVEHQELINSCVGNAFAGAYEFLIKSRTQKHIDVSRLFIYYNSRIIDGQEEGAMEDGGTCIPSAIESLRKHGCCKEQLFPYKSTKVNEKPSSECYKEAVLYRVEQAVELEPKLDEMKACLAEGFPFVFGLQLFQSFHEAENNGGFVRTPNTQYESQSEVHGWHALLAAGYDDSQQHFIVRNSWGEDWGDRGYCYIPYDYMTDPDCCADIHAIKSVSDGSSRHIYNPVPDFNNLTIDTNKNNSFIDYNPSYLDNSQYPYYPSYPDDNSYPYYTPYSDNQPSPYDSTYSDNSSYPHYPPYVDNKPSPYYPPYPDNQPFPYGPTYPDNDINLYYPPYSDNKHTPYPDNKPTPHGPTNPDSKPAPYYPPYGPTYPDNDVNLYYPPYPDNKRSPYDPTNPDNKPSPHMDDKPVDSSNNNFDNVKYWIAHISDNNAKKWPNPNVDTPTDTTQLVEPSEDSSQNNMRPSFNDQLTSKYILWIDQANGNNRYVVNQIQQTKNVVVEYFETFAQAENYLLANSNKIRVPGIYQIITRGYYKSEDKNPLNLLQILNRLRLYKVPVLVFTQDKTGLLTHLNNQAPSMNTNDWHQRLFITQNSSELIQKLQENIDAH